MDYSWLYREPAPAYIPSIDKFASDGQVWHGHNKLLEFAAYDEFTGAPGLTAVDHTLDDFGMTKTAASFPQEMVESISNIVPSKDKLWVVGNALGATETFGSNRNQDSFPRMGLMNSDPATYGHKTFESAYVFKHHCFPSGTEVILDNGDRVRIEDVREGQKVRTHRARPFEVEKVWVNDFEGSLVSLTVQGIDRPIEATPNHPVYVIRKGQVRCPKMKSAPNQCTPETLQQSEHCSRLSCAREEVPYEPEFVPAGDIQKGDYVLTPIGPQAPEAALSLTDRAEARFLGYFVAEGCYGGRTLEGPRSLQFTFGADESHLVKDVIECARTLGLKPTGPYPHHENNTLLVTINDTVFARAFADRAGDTLAAGARIPREVFLWPRQKALHFLGAYLDGDGHQSCEEVRNEGRVRGRSTSRDLLYDLKDLSLRLGIPVSVVWDGKVRALPPKRYTRKDGSVTVYRGYTTSESGCITFGSSRAEVLADYCCKIDKVACSSIKSKGPFIWKGYLVSPVRKVASRKYEGLVYNFKVTGDETYVAGEIAVHNCNKDPNKSIGKVEYAFYDELLDKVLLLYYILRDKAPHIVSRLEDGDSLETSMGCRCPYDVCSISGCHKKAKNRTEYCKHLKEYPNAVMPDGQKVMAHTPHPHFFDQSHVAKGADAIAKTLTVVDHLAKLSWNARPRHFIVGANTASLALVKTATSTHMRALSPTPEPRVGDKVKVRLEDRTKMDSHQIIPMGDIPGTLNEADGDPWDASPIDVPLSKVTGTVTGRVVGKIGVPDGNHKLIVKTKSGRMSARQKQDLQSYQAARSVWQRGLKMEVPGVSDVVVKTSEDRAQVRIQDPNTGNVGTVDAFAKKLADEITLGSLNGMPEEILAKKAREIQATIEKEVPGMATTVMAVLEKMTKQTAAQEEKEASFAQEFLPLLESFEPEMTPELMNKLAERYSFREVISSLAGEGIVLRPNEFQHFVHSYDYQKLASMEEVLVPEPRYIRSGLIQKLAGEFIIARSCLPENLYQRSIAMIGSLTKSAQGPQMSPQQMMQMMQMMSMQQGGGQGTPQAGEYKLPPGVQASVMQDAILKMYQTNMGQMDSSAFDRIPDMAIKAGSLSKEASAADMIDVCRGVPTRAYLKYAYQERGPSGLVSDWSQLNIPASNVWYQEFVAKPRESLEKTAQVLSLGSRELLDAATTVNLRFVRDVLAVSAVS